MMNHHCLVRGLLLLTWFSGCGSDNGSPVNEGGMPSGGGAGGAAIAEVGGTATAQAKGGNGTAGVVTTGGAAPTPNSPFSGKLAINEVCPSNKTGPMDEAGAYPDWIELYNSSSEAINLSGFYLSDDSDEPTKSPLAASLSIKPGGVLLIWSDGDAVEQGALHTSFSLSAGGEMVLLLDPDQKVIDSVEWTGAAPDTAYSRFPDGTGPFSWCARGTPNRANGNSCGQ